MSVAFGIYIGCSSCCIAVSKDGKVEVVANAAGDRVTPAVVAFHDMEVVTGLSAKQGIIRHGANTVLNVLRVVGTVEDEGMCPSSMSCRPNWDSGQPRYSVQRGERMVQISADEVLTHIFSLLKEIASAHTSEPELPVVIAVPAWSSEGTIAAVKKAASKAAFTVLTTVTQPAAAVLTYDLLNDNKHNTQVVVLHCGGTTVVGSVVEVAGGMLTLKESITSSTVAGDTLTDVLVQHFATEFYKKYKGDPLENKRSRMKLYNAAENCKHVLSTMGTAQVYVESLWEGVDFSTSLSRARFDGLVMATLLAFLQTAKEAVQRSGLTVNHIQKIILTGGSAKIPRLQQLVGEAFPQAEFLCTVPPDEVLAAGASTEASLLLGQPSHSPTTSSMVPALAASVFCMILGSENSECVFSRGTPTHSRQSLNLALPSPIPSSCSVVIYEAEEAANQPQEEAVLVQVNVTSLTTDSKLLKMDFHLKSDGSLHVALQEPEAKINRTFIIEAGRS
ncbi:heat shock 70 kDa protein 14 isoform X2 [Procambarus clarkii]|uniref:heat shock 70 kDa protein 14 isoform X2 n=1 Tax=Procambarus clarkii TaxID=6728 RepID=UPI001E673020|nr:heat shock 70 kDa protein 14-like [Procambarus clarkii]